jgi:hypothetical protein
MTANKSPLKIEDNDRRIYFISTPNTFDSSPQCIAAKSSRDIYHAITTQIEDIAYWLATKVENLNDNDYTTARINKAKWTDILKKTKVNEFDEEVDTLKRASLLINMEDWTQLAKYLLDNGGTTRFLDTKDKDFIIIANLADDMEAMMGQPLDIDLSDAKRPMVQYLKSSSGINYIRKNDKNVRGSRRWNKKPNFNRFEAPNIHEVELEAQAEPVMVDEDIDLEGVNDDQRTAIRV